MASKRKTKRRSPKPKPAPKKRRAPQRKRAASPRRRKASTDDAATVQVPVFDLNATQQLPAAQVLGDIEEAMALDRIREDD
jgi:hypothetical protein